MKRILLIMMIGVVNIFSAQSLNENISFKNLTQEENIQIEKIKGLLTQSKIIIIKDCKLINYDNCIDEYTIVYLYNNKPVLIDQIEFSFIRAYVSNGTEETSNYITKTRIYITDWENSKFIGKTIRLSQHGKSESSPYLNKHEIEAKIKR
ncbi:hypothetical protein [Chryseobacterium sp. 3008163]|uniref:hypothetical protein n=1 Tax=Chryseobacterium sp. 3008163 TaxID=2478663 RepID=UPI000F0BDDED|nr:hypothetical protein [Chryseobacterium sp. 3008163]AYM99938.1 hypothetical protein EAG08_05955 [Chryseobacterium sp. 3008163]